MINIIRKRFNYVYSNACLVLIGLNCLVFIITYLNPDLKVYLGLCPALVLKNKFFWQFLTYMFIHGGAFHLLGNMIGLFFFGMATERALGTKEFLLLYFLCGILSGGLSFIYYITKGQYVVFLIGASGALYSVLFAFAVIYPRTRVFIWGVIPIPSPLMVIGYAAIELFSQFTGREGNVAHYTHLFGFLVAYLYFLLRLGVNPLKVWQDTYRR